MKKVCLVKTYQEIEVCDCGGLFKQQYGNLIYMTSPSQADYICSGCGKIKRLTTPKTWYDYVEG